MNPNKFHFVPDQFLYLGTTVSAGGISSTKEMVKAIREAEAPTNVPELQSFLGSVNFLPKILPDFERIALLCTSYFVKKHPGNGENLNKKLWITSKLLCAPIRFYDTMMRLLNWFYSVTHPLLAWEPHNVNRDLMIHLYLFLYHL